MGPREVKGAAKIQLKERCPEHFLAGEAPIAGGRGSVVEAEKQSGGSG
jgi:hypothetical protein